MNVLDYYPRPWRVTTTSKARKTGGDHNYHIRAANDMYVAERLMGGNNIATLIVDSVNERDQLRQRAEAAEVKLAVIPMDAIRYCWLTEVVDRDDELWALHSDRIEAWLQTHV